MKQYIDVMRDVLQNGDTKTSRTGVGTISKFGGMMKFSLRHQIWPIPTTRQIAHLKISEELEWMLKGLVSVTWLQDHNNKIWDSWSGPESKTIGPMYGEQWRNWSAGISELEGEDQKRLEEIMREDSWEVDGGHELNPAIAIEAVKKFLDEKTKLYEKGGRGGVDQLQNLLDELKNSPDSRRLVVNVWHASLLPDTSKSPAENADNGKMALAPCHSTWQVNTAPMTDIEILRYIVEKNDDFEKVVLEPAFSTISMGHEPMEDYVRVATNMYLLTKRLVASNEVQPHLGNDRHLYLTDEGLDMVRLHIEKGGETRKLSLLCFARSQDLPLGTVFNVGMYSLLAHLLAQCTNMVPWEYTHFMGDHHIYDNQHEAVFKQINRTPMRPCRILVDPSIRHPEQFVAKNLQVFYESHPPIKFPPAAV